MSDHVCLPIYLQEPFASALFNSRLPSCNSREKHFSLAYFIHQLQ